MFWSSHGFTFSMKANLFLFFCLLLGKNSYEVVNQALNLIIISVMLMVYLTRAFRSFSNFDTVYILAHRCFRVCSGRTKLRTKCRNYKLIRCFKKVMKEITCKKLKSFRYQWKRRSCSGPSILYSISLQTKTNLTKPLTKAFLIAVNCKWFHTAPIFFII